MAMALTPEEIVAAEAATYYSPSWWGHKGRL